jgi:biotin carboxylase
MIKASNGGGGKGIRKCECAEDFPSMFRQVKSEVAGSPIFIMEYANASRHLEGKKMSSVNLNCLYMYKKGKNLYYEKSVYIHHGAHVQKQIFALKTENVF